MDGTKLFEPESMYAIKGWVFPIWDFFLVLLLFLLLSYPPFESFSHKP